MPTSCAALRRAEPFSRFPGLLAACGGGSKSAATTAAAGGTQTLPKTIVWSNWPLYIDINDKTKKHPTLHAFEAKYKVNVRYLEDINDNDSFFGKIEGQLSQGQSVGRDIVVLTDSSGLPARMIELGWLEKLDKSALPNISNLQPVQQHPGWDPNRDYSLPWQSGMTGIGYDPKKVGGDITSIKELLTNPKLKGKVTMLTEFGDTMGLVMLCERRRPVERHRCFLRPRRQDDQDGGRLRADPPVHRQRLRAAAREGRRLGVLPRGRATWCSCRPTIPA